MIDLSKEIKNSLEQISLLEQWTLDNDVYPGFSSVIDRTKFVLKKIGQASDRKPCIGFFGESQVGKSFLVGSLLSGTSDQLLVSHHDDTEGYNFLEKLNPNKQSEATAVVTRFTTDCVNKFDGDKFYIELLTPGELLRCIYEGYYLKMNESGSTLQDEVELEKLVENVQANRGNTLSSFYSDDFKDNYYKIIERLQELNQMHTTGYAKKAYASMNKTNTISINAVLSAARLLWYDYEPNSNLYKQLVNLLVNWGEPSVAYLSVDILSSMLDAGYLNQYKFTEAQENRVFIEGVPQHVDGSNSIVFSRNSEGHDLSLLQILAKEVALNIVGECSPLLANFDGIDFPGVKPIGDKETHFTPQEALDHEARYLIEVIKIGKLKQLFTLHLESRDLSSVLLCIQEGEQNPTHVSKLISNYVHQNPAWNDEKGADSLITVMTKTDILLSTPADRELAAERWDTRFTTHFEQHFSDVLESRRKKDAYRNVFLILNPNAPNYDKDSNISEYEGSYFENHYVDKYVYSKEENWRSLVADDGGIEHLHGSLLEKFEDRHLTYIAGLKKEFIASLKAIYGEFSNLIPEEDEQAAKEQAQAELRSLLSSLYDHPSDFEKLMDEVILWIPSIDASVFEVIQDGPRQRRSN